MGVDLKVSSGQRQYEGDSTQLARRRAGKLPDPSLGTTVASFVVRIAEPGPGNS